MRQQRAVERRVRAARFPVLKNLDQFHWDWPKKINELQVKNLLRLSFVEKKTNVILMGGVGLVGVAGPGHRERAPAGGAPGPLREVLGLWVEETDAVMASEKNECSGITTSRITRRTMYGGRCGPGSMPMRLQKNSEPASRKCTPMKMWPQWLVMSAGKIAVR